MGDKMRVYELAQKLGLDNKVLLERLKTAGIEAKNHLSVLDAAALQAFEGGNAPVEASEEKVVEEKIEEQRINPGIIRRRRKEVPKADEVPADEPVAAEPESVDTGEEAVAPIEKTDMVEKAAPAAEPVAEAPVPAEEDTAVSEEASSEVETKEPVAEVKAEPEAKAPPAPQVSEEVEKPKVTEKSEKEEKEEKPKAAAVQEATASQAKILGRVELSQLAPAKKATPAKPSRPRPARGNGSPRPQERPTQVVPPEVLVQEETSRAGKKKKGKGSGPRENDLRDGGRGRRPKREIFEPDRDRRPRRGKKGAKPVQKTEVTTSKAIKRIIRISDVITVGELAKRMGIKANDLIKELMRQGSMVTINHPLDYETAALLATEFNHEVENVAFDEDIILEDVGIESDASEDSSNLQTRPPVVTIMGHVDHGKTSLLDAIRTTDVTAGEAGGITQHIGAYDVELDGRKITFLDTPGHEAFTAMRARGAEATDIVVLVVAADDGVMPQTKEAINHSKAAGVPIIVAVNKIDKPGADPNRVKQELTEFEMVPEDWGGDTIFVEVSAKEHTNLESLLEMILLQAEVLELQANPIKRAKGIIVEARLDKGRGPVATVLVQEGTLRIGDPIVSGVNFGRVRTMTDDRGCQLEEAGPSCPVEVTGLSGTPDAGEPFHAVENEKAAKDVAGHRQRKLREAELASSSKISLDQLYARLQEGDVKELKVIIKGDVQGSVEAVKDTLGKLSTDACRLVVIHSAVGGIIESDVSLAAASDAIILGFNVRPEPKANAQADLDGVDIRLYNIIYDAVEDIRNAMEGLLAPIFKEKELGRVEVRETFHVSKVGTIAGCYVTDGKIVRGAQVRLVRDNIVVWEGKMSSLKRFKDDVKEVTNGYECGISLENYNDIKVGDVIEAFEMEATKATL
ncbi:translation initiation factor IF-2 [Syntrophotalea acetylenivorans]|uniref:Translation initiation factor IF-2 n=1 Tax=Syntrophotalea acetylenivorans TaxID=1842532 RepID=A0A1L3GLU6_9BACT|nr:translation initiation factor IF-2 [Syntrophotalea acetylenivorans]APG26913.1 translation initiation factor IF-2 [Syntrophotalea acetylenivorans]